MQRPVMMLALMAAMLLIAYFTSSSPVEIVATTTGLLSVWFTARQNLWAWPTGLVSVACFFYMFWEVKLYADMTLQIVFFVLSIYGWYNWMRNRQGAAVRPTRRMTGGEAVVSLLLLIAVTWGWGHILANYTDASIPYVDACIATLSLLAQFWLSAKVLENWYLWLVVDVLSIGMYTYKELYSLTFLYVIFFAIAASGLISWQRDFSAANRKRIRL